MAACTKWRRKPPVCGQDAPENCCLNCDFLVTKENPDHPFSINEQERKCLLSELTKDKRDPRRMTNDVLSKYKCYKSIWEQGGIEQEVKNQPAEANGTTTKGQSKIWDCSQVIQDRGDSCFFFLYELRRRLVATAELEGRVSTRREAEKDRKLTRRAFLVAFFALIISFLAFVANLIWNAWAHYHPFSS